jgi:hypothetical protein
LGLSSHNPWSIDTQLYLEAREMGQDRQKGYMKYMRMMKDKSLRLQFRTRDCFRAFDIDMGFLMMVTPWLRRSYF